MPQHSVRFVVLATLASTIACDPAPGDPQRDRGGQSGASDTDDDNSNDTDDDSNDTDDSHDTDDCCSATGSVPGNCSTDDGGGASSDTGDDGGEADLPYDAKLQVGDTFKLSDAFLEKGPLPDAILEVSMDGGDWRLAELQSDTVFEVTQADCDHEGNRDIGRDRVFVTWRNGDGSEETDHLDLRYCDG